MIKEIEELQKIVNDESVSAERRKAAAKQILAFEAEPGAPTVQLPATAPATRKFTDAENASLAEIKRMLAETIKDDPKPYLNAHKKCAVCLRHQSKQATKCELCSSEGRWETVTEHHPTWKQIGRAHPSTREHLSNLTTYGKKFEAAHLRFLMNWREGAGTRQINAATFVPTPYVLSFDQRCWAKQLLEWIEPGVIVAEPEADAPETELESDATPTQGREKTPVAI